MSGLPGTPPPLLSALVETLDPETNALVEEHLLGHTPAEWLATTLRRFGHEISPSTIRTYRRSLGLEGDVIV